QVIQVKTIVMDPHFDMLSYNSDTALMQLDVPLDYKAAMRPACLPNSRDVILLPLCTVSEWGSIKEGVSSDSAFRWLQQTQVPVLENEICERNYYFRHPGGITARMLHAAFVSVGGQDS
ncbi:OVCH1 protein, partial [Trogon melanurus]|nr:OVCH1 protein [Trogon melanurus]